VVEAWSDAHADVASEALGDVASDAGACTRHTLTDVALSSVELVEGELFLTHGRALRLRVCYPYRAGCDQPGPIDVTVQPGNATDFLSIRARLWKSDEAGPCLNGDVEQVLVVSDD